MINYSKNLYQYNHDTVGRFKDISTVVGRIHDCGFDKPESHDLFQMAHETILKMVKTSKEVIRCSFEHQMVLHIVDYDPRPNTAQIYIDDLILELRIDGKRFDYYFNINENDMDLRLACGKLLALLPLKEVKVELKNHLERDEIFSICQKCLK